MSVALDFAHFHIEINPNGREEQRVTCPKCGQKELGVNVLNGKFQCFRGSCNFKGIAIAPSSDGESIPKIDWILSQTVPLAGTLGEQYLKSRGCAMPPPGADLRFMPARGSYPAAMVGIVTNAITNVRQTLHFTSLGPDARKCGDRPKRLLAGHPKAGGLIRLWPDDMVTHGLAIAEGIETALTAAHAYTPVWSCVDAGKLAAMPVLDGIESLVIIVDNDAAGRRAAATCARRWAAAGREVRLAAPTVDGHDFNDMVSAA